MRLHYQESRQTMTPEKSLQFLKEGNERFIKNLKVNRDHIEMINITSDNQFPFASILSCSDSRTSSELIFDQGLGDLFSVRLAGNIASIDAIASLEFSCKILGSKLIVVLGHSNCGAVKGACDKKEVYNLVHLLNHIYPAIENEKTILENRTSGNDEFLQKVTDLNVDYQIEMIRNKSELLNQMINDKEIGIIGGTYDVRSGSVRFHTDTII